MYIRSIRDTKTEIGVYNPGAPLGGVNPSRTGIYIYILVFSLAFAVRVICFLVGVQPLQPPPPNFYSVWGKAPRSQASTLWP